MKSKESLHTNSETQFYGKLTWDTLSEINVNPLIPENVTLESTNYASLAEAMGEEKYASFQEENDLAYLGRIGESLQNASQILDNTQFAYGQYTTESGDIPLVFIRKLLSGGKGCVYTVDLNNSRPYLYRIENLYLVNQSDNAVDLLEEVDEDVQSFFMPIERSRYAHPTRQLFFGDIDLHERSLEDLGYGAHIHEIGHFKDALINPQAYALHSFNAGIDGLLINFTLAAEEFFGSLRGKSGFLDKRVYPKLEQISAIDLLMEDNANAFVSQFYEMKRAQGVELNSKEDQPQLERTLRRSNALHEAMTLGSSTMGGLEIDKVGVDWGDFKVSIEDKIQFWVQVNMAKEINKRCKELNRS